MEITRTELRTTRIDIKPRGSSYLMIELTNSSAAPEWLMSLVDYDGGVGAVGIFASEEEAMNNLDAFFEEAVHLYDKKYGKYGRTPTITLVGGRLHIEIPPKQSWDDAEDVGAGADCPRAP